MISIASVFSGSPGPKFIPYFSLGDPDYSSSVEWGKALVEGGADFLELGIPFSDPIADGPVIQKSYKRALDASPFSMEKILETTAKIHRTNTKIPLLYLTYLNPVYSFGLDRFLKSSFESGIRGLVIPDLPFDAREAIELFESAKARSIDLINLVTPATPVQRIQKMRKFSSGFIYYVTSFGVTGERASFAKDSDKRIARIQKEMKLPVCAGFGISTPEQAKMFSHISDGVIIGSAIQRIIENNGQNPDKCKSMLREYAASIKAAMTP